MYKGQSHGGPPRNVDLVTRIVMEEMHNLTEFSLLILEPIKRTHLWAEMIIEGIPEVNVENVIWPLTGM